MNNISDDQPSSKPTVSNVRRIGECRRSNYVQAAYVDAALTIKDLYGLRRAENILRGADVPMAVISRALLIGEPLRLHMTSKSPADKSD